MPIASRTPLPIVVQQHVQETASLRATREFLVRAPHIGLFHLRRLDDRLAAHLDGIAVAGEAGAQLCDLALESPGIGEVFAATVRAIEDRSAATMTRLIGLAEAEPGANAGLLSAFGWVSAASLRGITKELLASRSAFQRSVGLAACSMHQVDPGPALAAAMNDPNPALRRRALRVAGELGRLDLLPACVQALSPEPPDFHTAQAALLLGDRDASMLGLHTLAREPGLRRLDAIRLWLQVTAPKEARVFLKQLAQNPADVRLLIAGIGAAGDTHYVPWLVQQMPNPKLARLAGEAFSTITGLDLALLDLELKPPEGVQTGPSDDPADDDVAMDEDDSLPWPDPAKIAAWWQANGGKFASGTRCFMGELPSATHCQAVLAIGFQRQRIAAALHLRLLAPGRPLFNTAAPAWRQQRLLAGAPS